MDEHQGVGLVGSERDFQPSELPPRARSKSQAAHMRAGTERQHKANYILFFEHLLD